MKLLSESAIACCVRWRVRAVFPSTQSRQNASSDGTGTGFLLDTALRHVASRVSGKVEDRMFVRTRRFSVSTDASAETGHKLKLSQTDYRTRMKRPTIYVCPGSFPGEMSRRTARSFKFNYSNPNTNV